MRKKAPDGLTAIERAILARLKKGPAALSSLAHAARCKSSSIKVHISRLRKKLPCGITIPRSMYGYLTYSLQSSVAMNPDCNASCCGAETGSLPGNRDEETGSGERKNTKSNNMLYAAESLPDYTLCEYTFARIRWISNLARATILCSYPKYGAA